MPSLDTTPVVAHRLARLLLRVREQRYYELPIPVAEFDAAPGEKAI